MLKASLAAAAALPLLAITLTACDSGAGAAQPAHDHGAGHDDEHAELAEPMSRMQYYSHKLGYAIQAENAALADFYLHELEELAAKVQEEIPQYEGLAIAGLMEQVLAPSLRVQREALEGVQEDGWEPAYQHYQRVIKSCNGCHAVTEHAFIVITPAEGDPPFNQRFGPE